MARLSKWMPSSVEHVGVAVEDGDVGAQADRHLRGIEADHPAADDRHLGRHHARHAAEQHAAAAVRLFEAVAPAWIDMPPGDLAHRLQQRQQPPRAGDRLVGDAVTPDLIRSRGLLGSGGEVEIGEEDLTLAQHRALGRLRLLDLHDHVAPAKTSSASAAISAPAAS